LKNLFEFYFDSDRATWRYGIRWYRFGRISIVDRRIQVDLDVQDLPIPLHLSDLLGSLDLDPMDGINEGEMLTGVLGFGRRR
jgi:hypothetical protein